MMQGRPHYESTVVIEVSLKDGRSGIRVASVQARIQGNAKLDDPRHGDLLAGLEPAFQKPGVRTRGFRIVMAMYQWLEFSHFGPDVRYWGSDEGIEAGIGIDAVLLRGW